MTETNQGAAPRSIAHKQDFGAARFYPDGTVPWSEPKAPDVNAGGLNHSIGRLRSCEYCGSMHPADVAAAIRAGAKGEWADRKYGWPHKAYFHDVPNPHAGMLEVRSSSTVKSERYQREVREPRYDEKTGERVADYVTYTEEPQPASATTSGKFYTVHLQDATPEDRETIERHLGIAFEFMGDGVSWRPAEQVYGAAPAAGSEG
jgi:hypothetical protein